MFNNNMTIYNKYYDSSKDLDVYKRTELRNVIWSSQEGRIRMKQGLTSQDKVIIYINAESVISSNIYVNPGDFIDLVDKEGYYTITSGDLVVKGLDTPEIISYRDLDRYFTVNTVDFHDFGSKGMVNWEVMAK